MIFVFFHPVTSRETDCESLSIKRAHCRPSELTHSSHKMSNNNNHNDKKVEKTLDPSISSPEYQEAGTERHASVDSATFFEGGDGYEDYDDFVAVGGGGGGTGNSKNKTEKRQQNRGGGGSGTIYSAKHVRQKEALKSGGGTKTTRSSSPKK